MPARSAVARLQQVTSLALLACALGWLFSHWQRSPGLAAAGAAAIAFSHAALLGLQFILLALAGQDAATPRPRPVQLVLAWLAEAWQAARVFGWRQPFRWREVPDELDPAPASSTPCGIVFIHGFLCNRGFWTPWLQQARAAGHPFVAVNLEPLFGSIDNYVAIVENAVERVSRATGRPPLLICHSMGGLAARAWLRMPQAQDRVAHVITIGTPHHGTWIARFSRKSNGRQMRLGSDWLGALAAESSPARPGLFTCWYSNCDNIVFPASTATLPGADNRLVPGAAHVELAFRPEVMAQSLALARAL